VQAADVPARRSYGYRSRKFLFQEKDQPRAGSKPLRDRSQIVELVFVELDFPAIGSRSKIRSRRQWTGWRTRLAKWKKPWTRAGKRAAGPGVPQNARPAGPGAVRVGL